MLFCQGDELKLPEQVHEHALAGVALIGEVVGEIRDAVADPDLGIVAQVTIDRGEAAPARVPGTIRC
jgi:hypothetical protein